MSITNGSVALTVFRIQQDMRFASCFLNREALFMRRFKPIDETPEWKTAMGWTGFENMLDLDFSQSRPQIGEYLAFSLRTDRRAVPPAVLKKHYAQALQKEEASYRNAAEAWAWLDPALRPQEAEPATAGKAGGKPFISRERKKELLEQVKTRLTARAEPVPASCGVVVNTRTGLVFLGSASPKTAQAFQKMFAATFNLDLLPLDACLLAGEPRAGRVFLTRVFSRGLRLPARHIDPEAPASEVGFGFAGRVVVVGEETELSGTARNGGDIAEIEAGVEAGKEVIKLGLRLDWEPDSFTMTLDQDLRLTGLRLPCPPMPGSSAPRAPHAGQDRAPHTPQGRAPHAGQDRAGQSRAGHTGQGFRDDKGAAGPWAWPDRTQPWEAQPSAAREAQPWGTREAAPAAMEEDGAFLERMRLIEKAVAAIHAACKAAWTDHYLPAGSNGLCAALRPQAPAGRMEVH